MKRHIVIIGIVLFVLSSTTGTGLNQSQKDSGTTFGEVCQSHIDIPVLGHPGDILFLYDITVACGEQGGLGVEYDGQYFYVTGFYNGDTLKRVYFFDKNGTYLSSAIQPTIEYGWRDIAFDGEYMYSSYGEYIDKWSVSGLPDNPEILFIDRVLGPLPVNRGLAYDPATDHFWTADFRSVIYEIDRNGNIINTYDNMLAIYGMAWDRYSADGPWLWMYTQDGDPLCTISQFNPRTGEYTDVNFQGGTLTPYGIAGGLTCYQEGSKAILLGLTQNGGNNDTDIIFGMELTSSPLQIQTLRGGLGVTVALENTGAGDLSNVTYAISFDGGMLLSPREPITGTIDSIQADATKRIHAFVLGFGSTMITTTVQAGGLPVSKSSSAMILGPMVLINKE